MPEHVAVASFVSAGEAAMAASKLQSEDVDCHVMQHAALEGISARGATVLVEAEQFGRAVEVLSTTPARRCLLVNPVLPLNEEGVARPGLAARLRRWWGKPNGTAPPPTKG